MLATLRSGIAASKRARVAHVARAARLTSRNVHAKRRSVSFPREKNIQHTRAYSTVVVVPPPHTPSIKPNPSGMLTLEQLAQCAKAGTIDTVIVAFTDHVGRFYGKRYDVDFFLSDGVSGTHACDYLLTIDIAQNILGGFEFSSWETGYGDFHAVPDMATLRVATWLDRTALVQCDLISPLTHELIPQGPRSVLKKQLDRLKPFGLAAKGASELEYYMYKNSYETANEFDYSEKHLKPFGYYLADYNILQGTREDVFNAEVRRHLKWSGIPVENSKGEYGHGQHELNVRYSDLLTMADRHAVYKQCFKELAQKMGVSVTFMAKPHANESGSSCHIHVSLWDENGKNAFLGQEDLDGVSCSSTFKHFLGGWVKHVPEIMPFLAPTINSYKRFRAGSWAPTKCAWSDDNRTAGFRVLGQGGPGFRIECRIPGADVNPYLAFAGLLACGIHGIENKIEPPAKVSGDLYSKKLTKKGDVARTLKDAVDKFASSHFTKETFGTDVVEHYAHFYRKEVEQYNNAVTDWERKRYFEQI